MTAREGLATRHYFDSVFNYQAVKVLPNEYYVTGDDVLISTVLGSCVAACIRDPRAGVGGMNHFMLPDGDSQSPASATMRYGAFAMEMLINELLKLGASRDHLEAKVFGGGAVLLAMQQMNIGERNADFVLEYLRIEQIPVLAQDLCGEQARRVNYFPRTGKVLVRKMQSHRKVDSILVRREQALEQSLQADVPTPRFELFGLPPRKEVR